MMIAYLFVPQRDDDISLSVICHKKMEKELEYIEFHINNESKYKDMKSVYSSIAEAKNNCQPKPLERWLEIFPNYSIKHFYFSDLDVKPIFRTASKEEEVWRFKGMINLLQLELDVNYKRCERTEKIGRIEFSANGYPFGGITGLTMFLNSFECKATEIYDGGEKYLVNWLNDNKFELQGLKKSILNNAKTELISNQKKNRTLDKIKKLLHWK